LIPSVPRPLPGEAGFKHRITATQELLRGIGEQRGERRLGRGRAQAWLGELPRIAQDTA